MTPKRKLTLKKEVVTSLSNNNQILGGGDPIHPLSYNATECGDSVCICMVTHTCNNSACLCMPDTIKQSLCIKCQIEESLVYTECKAKP